MQNPSYLIRSRHAIYYFRYPVANHSNGKISVSLNTRCPKEALRLSKILEYHAFMVMSNKDVQTLDYVEVKEILKKHFAEVLERMKRTIDKEGALSDDKVVRFQELQGDALEAIRFDENEIHAVYFSDDSEIPYALSLDKRLKPIAERYDIQIDRDSAEYSVMRKEYKYALNGYISALLSYNEGSGFYDHALPKDKPNQNSNRELKLGHIIDAYLEEINGTMGDRSYRDQSDCIRYLLEVFGENYFITDIDYSKVRKIKNMLQNTPSNRNKLQLTRGLSLAQQVEAKDTYDLKVMSISNINKYLGYMSALFNWAMQNKYVSENPFKGMKLKQKKKDIKRNPFKKEQVQVILNALSKMDTSKPLAKTRYWAAMIAIYTGARLNEVASLTPDDIREDKETGILYFNITDEEESKKIKTEAGKRVVPVHSNLIELGFLEYIKHAREVIGKRPKVGEHPTRLLYQLTYTDAGWGRKIGSWFNGTLLPELELKTNKTTLHSLRHSFITSLNNAGVEPSTIKSLVGHEQGTVTFSVYAHYGVEHLPVSSKALGELPY